MDLPNRHSLRRALRVLGLLGLLAGVAGAGRIEFRDPDPKGPRERVWQITDRPNVDHVIEYHNTQCWSPTGRYLAYTAYHTGDLWIYDLQEDREIPLGKGGSPRWANKHDWLFFIRSDPKGSTLTWRDIASGKEVGLATENKTDEVWFPGETDCEDRWLFTNKRFVDYVMRDGKRRRRKRYWTYRLPLREGGKPKVILEFKGRRPLPNPRHPVIMQRYKSGGPFGSSRVWFDNEGRNLRTGVPMVQSGHQCWLGDGSYHLIGDDQVRGRKWDEPYPSNMHYLANIRFHDICPCGFSGRWTCVNGKIADLRSGHGRRYSFRYVYYPLPQGVGSVGDSDCNPKGSPDGTKVCYRSMVDMKDGRFTRLTQPLSTKGSERLHVESTEGFPESGDVVLFQEIVGYERKTPTTFEGLTRRKYDTRGRSFPAGYVLHDFRGLVVPPKLRKNAPMTRLRANIAAKKLVDKYGDTPVPWMRQRQVYCTIVRDPDPPHLRLRGGRVELIPGENHWETRGCLVLRDGQPVNTAVLKPGATLRLPKAGTYTAVAVERSGLKGKPSLPLKLDADADLVALRDKPADFSWTTDRWLVDGKAASADAAKRTDKAVREVVHRHDGVIAREFFEKGRRVARHDRNAEGQPTRKLTYRDGKLLRREYAHGERESIEDFAPDGFITHAKQWYQKAGKRRVYSEWWYERGVPVKRNLRGRTTYEKKGDDWVRGK